MAYVHVAGNCVIEDSVVISNAVALAGHIHIESRAVIEVWWEFTNLAYW